jgi:hypothetical protein
MPPTPLTPTTRYFPPGTRKVYWMTTTASYLAPTRGELNAGTDLSAEVAAMAGWAINSATADTPDMGSRFTSQIPARLDANGSQITFYLSQNSSDVRTLLTRDTNGFIVVLWEGDVTGQKMDVFPCRVMTDANETNTETPGQTTVMFSVTKLPAINVAIP